MTSTSGCIPASITSRSNPTEGCLSAALTTHVNQLPANHRAFHLATRYASFNALTVTGRIFNAEIVNGKNGEFLAVSVISTATKDGEDIVYTFTNGNGLMTLHSKGQFNKGREVTITGHIVNVSQVYTDKKTGEVRLRQRPEVSLQGVTVLEGGLGRMPSDDTVAKPAAGTVVKMTTKSAPVDEAPQLTKEEAQAAAF